MTPIKIILIILLLFALRAFIVQKSLVSIHKIIGFILFLVLLLLVLFPDLSVIVAHFVGVGRGPDLVFYFSHIFLLLLIIGLWRRSLDLKTTVTKLSRAIALQHPNRPCEESDRAGESLRRGRG